MEGVKRGVNIVFRNGETHSDGIKGVRKGHEDGERKGGTYANRIRYGNQANIFHKGVVFSFDNIKEDKDKLKKCYIEEVVYPGSTYNVQTNFQMEELFSIRVTPLGSSLFLLEKMK